MSERDWRKVITIGPVVAIVAVVIAIVAMDFTFNGTDEPKPENLAPPVPSVRAYTPLPATYVPPPTDTPTPGPTAISGAVAQVRDQRRKDDLEKTRAALEAYHAKNGDYPSTGNNVQSFCTYKDIDALCKLKDFLDPIPMDPDQSSYSYVSDGKTFTLIAVMDDPANATPTKCDARFAEHLKKSNLYCLTVGQ